MTIAIPKACFDLIKQYEGLSLKPYICPAGKPTIGYGCTFYDDEKLVSMKDPEITKERALSLLENRALFFWEGVDRLVAPHLSPNQHGALTSFSYNFGLGALSTSTLLRKINADVFDPSIRDEFMRWNKANGTVVRGLVNRRIAEANLYFST